MYILHYIILKDKFELVLQSMKGSKSKGKSITSAHQIIQSQTVKKKRINIIPPINTVAK